MVVMHLLVDTRDAMGANLVNTMCEGVAHVVLTGGKVFLRILSNLTDRAIARATVRIPLKTLKERAIAAKKYAAGSCWPTIWPLPTLTVQTHNKGINGVDALALATGNDWRAIEAAAHAYAARSGRYRALTQWHKREEGYLVGEIAIPMKVGTVGGSLETNPSVRINQTAGLAKCIRACRYHGCGWTSTKFCCSCARYQPTAFSRTI